MITQAGETNETGSKQARVVYVAVDKMEEYEYEEWPGSAGGTGAGVG